MATYSNILAWKVSWTEELGRLQSIVLKEHSIHTHTHKDPALCLAHEMY